MNRYETMMERIAPPGGQAERLRRRVLAAAPAAKGRPYRPRSLGRKLALAAVLAAVLTATAGVAAELTAWDTLLAARFAPGAADNAVAREVFQDINVTALCGDVTLTVRQAVGDAQTLYLLMDYQLPETADLDAIQAQWDTGAGPTPPRFDLFGGTADWGDIRNMKEATARLTLASKLPSLLGSGMTETVAFDRERRTLTYLLSHALLEKVSPRKPVTLLVSPPQMDQGEEWRPLATSMALLTFQPTYTAQMKQGRAAADGVRYTAKLTPLALRLEMKSGEQVPTGLALGQHAALILADGTERPVNSLRMGDSGSTGSGVSSGVFGDTYRASCTVSLREPLSLDDVVAVRVWDTKIPLG